MVRLVLPVLRALLELVVFRVCLVFLVSRATEVSLVWMDLKVNLDQLVTRERKV